MLLVFFPCMWCFCVFDRLALLGLSIEPKLLDSYAVSLTDSGCTMLAMLLPGQLFLQAPFKWRAGPHTNAWAGTSDSMQKSQNCTSAS